MKKSIFTLAALSLTLSSCSRQFSGPKDNNPPKLIHVPFSLANTSLSLAGEVSDITLKMIGENCRSKDLHTANNGEIVVENDGFDSETNQPISNSSISFYFGDEGCELALKSLKINGRSYISVNNKDSWAVDQLGTVEDYSHNFSGPQGTSLKLRVLSQVSSPVRDSDRIEMSFVGSGVTTPVPITLPSSLNKTSSFSVSGTAPTFFTYDSLTPTTDGSQYNTLTHDKYYLRFSCPSAMTDSGNVDSDGNAIMSMCEGLDLFGTDLQMRYGFSPYPYTNPDDDYDINDEEISNIHGSIQSVYSDLIFIRDSNHFEILVEFPKGLGSNQYIPFTFGNVRGTPYGSLGSYQMFLFKY